MKTVYEEQDKTVIKTILVSAGFLLVSFSARAEVDIGGQAGIEARYFLQDAAYPEQQREYLSAYIEPEFYYEWNDRADSILFKPFFRIDQHDEERTHFDIRELQWLHASENWETRVGVAHVFWGQTESIHLVDIINQTDSIEAVDGEDKLGQPMVNLNVFGDWGTLSAFVLPYFRERTFAGMDGRLRPPIPIDGDNALYESDDEQSHVDYALRWRNSIGQWEVGVSFFDGTSREPELLTQFDGTGNASIRPYYAQIEQFGVDLLKVQGAWLLKFEGIYRTGQSEDFAAAVAGFERTSVGVFDTQYDLGLLMEYQYDERDDNFFATGQNDLMTGVRWVWNDIDGTEFLFGYIQDLDDFETYSGFVEASSRITDSWRWKIDAYFFSSDDETDTFYFLRRDDHIQLSLEHFF
ncbi:hypothetical protein OPS25_01775 [Alteromonas ponticola]|uniref:Uncharacterized protein n=1 Tax=Alteromonas aquimaris TaxID=2998417 RepID=A0ABT3P379_9ALTE|nr:hypothetical protein [Alteromonas aquimaris]MCW8107232.1 hypothetical protein [Alteromonas aquimaris]